MPFRPRRPFRRPGPRRFGPALFGPGAALLQTLIEANQLLTSGQPAEAARLYHDLAGTAEANGNLRRAANLRLEAARGSLAAGDAPAALAHARAALQLFARAGQFGRADTIYHRLLAEMRTRGLNAEAEALERDVQALFGHETTPAAGEAAAPARGRLPARCPQCGGPLRSDEVDWIDAHSAECVYCGSVVRAE
jgi:hypothetical protein